MMTRHRQFRPLDPHNQPNRAASEPSPTSELCTRAVHPLTVAAVLLSVLLAILAGCDNRPAPEPAASRPTVSDVPLRIAAPAEPQLLEAIRAAWEGVSEQPIEIRGVDEGDWIGAAKNADVVLLPSRSLGDAIAERVIIELPTSWLAKTGGTDDFLPALLDHQMRFGDKLFGLSLGSPVAVFTFDPSLSEQASAAENAAQRWELFDSLTGERAGTAVEPLAEGYAANQFLLRSSSRVERDWLFDRSSMRSRLADDPHYLTVLRQMVQGHESDSTAMTPAEVAEAVGTGNTKAAVVYSPTRAAGWLHLPIAPEERTLGIAPLQLPGEGLVACLASACRQSSQARQFLRWISGRDTVATLSASSLRVTLNRSGSSRDSGYTAAAVETLSRRGGFRPTLRLRGAAEYHQALDAAVRQCLAGEADAEEALQEASAEWDAITERLGVDQQRTSWLLSQGLPPDRSFSN